MMRTLLTNAFVWSFLLAFSLGFWWGCAALLTPECSDLFDTAGRTQEELLAARIAGDDLVGYDEITQCAYID